jgi:hypothetical protein
MTPFIHQMIKTKPLKKLKKELKKQAQKLSSMMKTEKLKNKKNMINKSE